MTLPTPTRQAVKLLIQFWKQPMDVERMVIPLTPYIANMIYEDRKEVAKELRELYPACASDNDKWERLGKLIDELDGEKVTKDV